MAQPKLGNLKPFLDLGPGLIQTCHPWDPGLGNTSVVVQLFIKIDQNQGSYQKILRTLLAGQWLLVEHDILRPKTWISKKRKALQLFIYTTVIQCVLTAMDSEQYKKGHATAGGTQNCILLVFLIAQTCQRHHFQGILIDAQNYILFV